MFDAESWFVAASISGAACASLATVVVAAGCRRRLPEVAMLGTALLTVSVLASVHGVSGTAIASGAGPALWAATAALPLGVLAGLPLMAPTSRPARAIAGHWGRWIVAVGIATVGVGAAALAVRAEVPTAAKLLAVALGGTGAALLARRQFALARISRRRPATITGVAISGVAVSALGALALEPGTGPSWVLLVAENAAVLGAGTAVLVGYHNGRGVAEVLGPILSREPLAALELGLSPEVHAFVRALERKDQVTRNHVVRTSALSMRLAIRAGLSPATVRSVALGGLLHDIGKLVIPSEIIDKPGGLTDEEYATIKTHPEQGERLLQGAPSLGAAAPYVRGHHERPDGRGYPDALAGQQISLEVGLVSVADAWDAMTHTRQYREGMAAERATSIVREGAGSQWRRDAVDILLAEIDAVGQVETDPLERIGRVPALEAESELLACACDDTFVGVHEVDGADRLPVRWSTVEPSSVLRQVLDASPIAMAVVGRDGRIVAVNRALAMLVDQPSDALAGAGFVDVFAESERPAATRALQTVLESGDILRAQNRRLGHSAGHERIVDLSMCVVEEAASQTCILVQAVGVTHRRRPQPHREDFAFSA